MPQQKQKRQPKGEYEVGYCRPPAQHRFRPGQSGNPSGERKRNDAKTIMDELKRVIATKIPVRHGERSRKVLLPTAILFAHGMNAVKGDAKSGALFFNQMQKLGLLEDEAFADMPAGPQRKSSPSEAVLQNVDIGLLSRDEQIELSRLAATIDQAGDVWALSAGEFERVKELVMKGRSTNVVAFPKTTP